MNKSEFKKHISTMSNLSQQEAERVIDIFVSAVTTALAQDDEVSFIGFGSFTVNKIAARNVHNPRTRETIKIAAYNQPKFKAGQKLKDACNP